MKKVFIDGSSGTTGLRIEDRLKTREDIEILHIPDELRKDNDTIRKYLNESDISFLCLPDAAAIEAAEMVTNPDTVIIDTSTAHRIDDAWTYGFPEINGLREKIRRSKRIANPGCHASGFVSLVAPLTENGVIPEDAELTCLSLTGYSGGGKKMIADYETGERDGLLEGPRLYGLSQNHKHLPEMKKICRLKKTPVFCPVVGTFYSGMEVIVPLFGDMINAGPDRIKEIYRDYYRSGLVKYRDACDENGFLSTVRYEHMDDMEISVHGNDEKILLVARFDNLGKGASGAAIQNMNITMGIDETTGLVVTEDK